MGSEMVSTEFAEVDFNQLAPEDRVEMVQQLLANEGFSVEVQNDGDGYHIKETSCPYVHIGKEHREVCIVDETMISTMLATPVEKTHCILDGDSFCAYHAPVISTSDIN